ncbi:hypothetical protein M3Y99_00953700 [Aphelenchoides fujianensis]|nr:hypothetical protein M3Y99_00953700 [Aphelenchoides fujianensis]
MSDSDEQEWSRIQIQPDSSYSYPTWRVMRRERTELGPKRAASGRETEEDETGDEEFVQSRTVTTTERVQILQMPLEVRGEEFARYSNFVYSPTGETTRQVNSTTTVIEAGSLPVISGVTKDGRSLQGGMLKTNRQKQTTTVITTTTTTYKVIDDPNGEEYELISNPDADQLTVEIPLVADRYGMTSGTGLSMVGSQTDSSLSPLTDEDTAVPLYKSKKYRARPAARAGEELPKNSSSSSFEFMEQPTSSSDADDEEFAYVSNEAAQFLRNEEDRTLRESPCSAEPTTSRRAVEFGSYPIDQFARIYHRGFYEGAPKEDEKAARRTGGFFKPGERREHPQTTAYSGPVDETRFREFAHHPIDDHARVVWPSGRSDVRPEDEWQEEERRMRREETRIPPGYPPIRAADRFEVEATNRRRELDSQPLEHQVAAYHSGWSTNEQPKEAKESAISKLTSLFKRDKPDDYPAHVHEGPVEDFARQREATHRELLEEVAVRHHGRSDLDAERREEVRKMAEEEMNTPLQEEIQSTQRSGYPLLHEPLDVNVASTRRTHDLRDEPLTSFVRVYASGRSDEVEEKPKESIASKIAGLFSKEKHDAYPPHHVHEGPVDHFAPLREAEGYPLSDHAAVYHSGRSDLKEEEKARDRTREAGRRAPDPNDDQLPSHRAARALRAADDRKKKRVGAPSAWCPLGRLLRVRPFSLVRRGRTNPKRSAGNPNTERIPNDPRAFRARCCLHVPPSRA